MFDEVVVVTQAMKDDERRVPQRAATDLGRHDQFVVDDVVWRKAHSEEGAGGVQMTRHTCTRVHVLPETLQTRTSWL